VNGNSKVSVEGKKRKVSRREGMAPEGKKK